MPDWPDLLRPLFLSSSWFHEQHSIHVSVVQKLGHRKNNNKMSQHAIQLLVVVRAISAFAAIISDCDETFNYWEPVCC
jgi:hypothetical protein